MRPGGEDLALLTTDELDMMKKSYLAWPAVLLTTFGLMASCGGKDGSSGDGDGDMGDGDGDGDGDIEDGDGDTGGSAMGGGGGQGGMTGSCPDECPNDNNPCTEDVCNPDTGECGIPRTGNACDDGIYCNGEDTCEEGKCSDHAGDPCEETSCNEGKKACECSQVEHCPGQDLSKHKYGGEGEWGTIANISECSYDSTCDEQCTCSYTKTLYECDLGSCKVTNADDPPKLDTACDSRETDGDLCESDNQYCNGNEVCKSGNCQPNAIDPCAGAGDGKNVCREASDSCVQCLENSDCADVGTDYHCCANSTDGFTCKAPDADCSLVVVQKVLQQALQQSIVNPQIAIEPTF